MRHIHGLRRKKNHPLVQHLVVLEVVQQRVRHGGRTGGEVDGRAFHPGGRIGGQAGDEILQVERMFFELATQQGAAALPGGQQGVDHGAEQQWEPAAVIDLQRVGRQKSQVDQREQAEHRIGPQGAPTPAVLRDHPAERGGDDHGDVHRDAVGRREVFRRFETQHQQNHEDQQQPVDEGHVDLTLIALIGEQHPHARQIPQLDRLRGDGVSAGDDCLRGDDGGGSRQCQQGPQRPRGRQIEKGILGGFRVRQHQRALAEVVKHQPGHHQTDPGELNRLAAEMPHVGIQRLAAGEHQKHRAQQNERHTGFAHEQLRTVIRVDRQQHRGVLHDLRQS